MITRLHLMLLALSFTAPVAAEEAATLTGNWGGLRPRLVDQGIIVTTIYTSEVANNPRGGEDEKTAYADEWAFAATLDLEALFGGEASRLQITVTDRNGHDLDLTAQLHTLMQVQEIYGRGQTWRLTELWYERQWFDNQVVWKLGRVTAGETFGAFSCDFQNLTFCGAQPGNVRGDYWYNYPVSQWGTRLDAIVGSRTQIKLGVYQDNPTYIDSSWAHHRGLFPDNPSGTTGALIPLELDWTPQLLGLPDKYQFGFWYDTSAEDDVYFDINHQPRVLTGDTPLRRHGRYGAYLAVQQQISGTNAMNGTQLFLNATQSDKDTSPLVDRQIAAGVRSQGLFSARPADVIGLAVGSSHVNSRVANGERLTDAFTGGDLPVQKSEYEAEFFYGWIPAPFLTFRFNLQYIANPGGVNAYANDVIFGLKTTLKF